MLIPGGRQRRLSPIPHRSLLHMLRSDSHLNRSCLSRNARILHTSLRRLEHPYLRSLSWRWFHPSPDLPSTSASSRPIETSRLPFRNVGMSRNNLLERQKSALRKERIQLNAYLCPGQSLLRSFVDFVTQGYKGTVGSSREFRHLTTKEV